MTAREQAIEAAARALWATRNNEPWIPEWADRERLNADAAAALAAAVPVLLNDLADRIEEGFVQFPHTQAGVRQNELVEKHAALVRAAAEGGEVNSEERSNEEAMLERIEQADEYFFPECAEYDGGLPAVADSVRDVIAERDAALARIAAVEALAEKWRYKGEFGWGAWQEGHGPDEEGYVLDQVSTELRAVLAASPTPTDPERCPECNHEPGCWCPETPTPHGCRTCLATPTGPETVECGNCGKPFPGEHEFEPGEGVAEMIICPTGPEPAKCEHKRTEAHAFMYRGVDGIAQSWCPGPATPEPTEETRPGHADPNLHVAARRRRFLAEHDAAAGPGGADPKETRP